MDSKQLRERLQSDVNKLTKEWLSWDKGIARTLAALRVRTIGRFPYSARH